MTYIEALQELHNIIADAFQCGRLLPDKKPGEDLYMEITEALWEANKAQENQNKTIGETK